MLIDARRRRRAQHLTYIPGSGRRPRPDRRRGEAGDPGRIPAGPGRGLPAQSAAAQRERSRTRRAARGRGRRALRRSARRISGTPAHLPAAAGHGLGGPAAHRTGLAVRHAGRRSTPARPGWPGCWTRSHRAAPGRGRSPAARAGRRDERRCRSRPVRPGGGRSAPRRPDAAPSPSARPGPEPCWSGSSPSPGPGPTPRRSRRSAPPASTRSPTPSPYWPPRCRSPRPPPHQRAGSRAWLVPAEPPSAGCWTRSPRCRWRRAAHPYNAEALVHGLATARRRGAGRPLAPGRQLLRLHRYAREVLCAGERRPTPTLRLTAGQALDRHRDAAEAAAAAAAAARTPRIAPATAYALGRAPRRPAPRGRGGPLRLPAGVAGRRRGRRAGQGRQTVAAP